MPLIQPVLAHFEPTALRHIAWRVFDFSFGFLFLVALVLLLSAFRGPR